LVTPIVNALVTGGTGFIGSHLVRALLARGDRVRVLDAFHTSTKQTLAEGAELVECDVRDADGVAAACRDIDVVFHLAAFRSVPKSVDDPRLATESNVLGTLNVLLGAEQAGVRRVVYASSSSVYGARDEGAIQREDDRPGPRSPYAASKLAGEYYCNVWTDLKGLSTVGLRYFNVFGPGQRPDSQYSAVFPAFISALVAGRAPVVHWDGEQTRDFTYVADVADATMRAGDADVDGSAILNIAGGTPKSVNDVLRAVSGSVGTWIEPERTPMRPGDVRASHADITRARDLLGWTPTAKWADSVAATVGWFKDTRPGD
jgi:UDP-glucose 4-epimerase